VLYLRALPLAEMAASPRAGEDAVRALLGDGAARLFSLAILASILGCLAATILYSSRIYQPMAADGVFFRALARISPEHHVPVRSLWLQSGWALLLTLTGSYAQLYTYVTFASVLALAATGAAVIVLRRTRPALERPYRTWGYPLVPLLFVLGAALLVASALWQSPRESLAGLALVALGLPAYAWWRRGARDRDGPGDGSRDGGSERGTRG
jgi:basic amino acid/polyamine antiporter, APA family